MSEEIEKIMQEFEVDFDNRNLTGLSLITECFDKIREELK